jgi:hypothetical protein
MCPLLEDCDVKDMVRRLSSCWIGEGEGNMFVGNCRVHYNYEYQNAALKFENVNDVTAIYIYFFVM